MPVIIDGTNGISGVDGSASTPAVQGTDTNTGMFFPAADTIAFAEGGTEVMRIDSSGNLRVGSSSTALNSINSTNTFGFKNRIINGAMMIDQRNAGASVTAGASITYFLDRWLYASAQASKFTIQQNAGAVTPPAGFKNYMGVTSSSAYSVLTGDYFTIDQKIEGLNCYDLNFGTANAQTITLSFWVRSSLTGTFAGGIYNGDAATRSYVFTYTINSANTWEYKTITIPGDTTGTWLTTTSAGMAIRFNLGGGSTYQSTAGSWQAGNYFATSASTNIVGTNGATFYITGVQLEKGSTATSFDYRPYGTELALCQRYFTRFGSGVAFEAYSMGEVIGTTSIRFLMQCPVVMRSSPTLTVGGSGLVWSLDRVGTVLSSISLAQATTQIQSITANTANGITIGQVGSVTAGNFTNTSVSFSSEL